MSETILHADGLYHVYESKAEEGNVVALRGLHIDMKAGEAIAVVGPSGSGKSTLMKCLGGLMKPSAGSVSLAGKNMTRLTGQELVELRQKTVSFIFQEGNLLPDLNARDNVAQPLRHQGVKSKKALALADAMLERLGMGHRIHALPAMLSGGEQQRVRLPVRSSPSRVLFWPTSQRALLTRSPAVRCWRCSRTCTRTTACPSSS